MILHNSKRKSWRKLFSKTSRLTDHEIVPALHALKLRSPLLKKSRYWTSWLLFAET